MTTIYLIRHAEAEGNLYRRAHGWYNSTITDRGYRQIAALTKRFTDTKFDAVYSSDRFRTMITALSIYKTHGLPLRTVRALRLCRTASRTCRMISARLADSCFCTSAYFATTDAKHGSLCMRALNAPTTARSRWRRSCVLRWT